jgi:hypothetical protein
VALAHRVELPGFSKPSDSVLAHGFQQAVAHLGAPLVGGDQRLVDQPGQQVEHG